MTRTVGASGLAAATPSAVETTPSMPLAPRLPRIATWRPAAGQKKVSQSRTGMLLPTTSVAPSGRIAASSRKTRPSNGAAKSRMVASMARWAASSVACQRWRQWPSRSAGALGAARRAAPWRAGARPHAGGRWRAGSAPPTARLVHDDLRAVREPLEVLEQRLGGRQRAEAQHEIRRRLAGERLRAQEGVVGVDACPGWRARRKADRPATVRAAARPSAKAARRVGGAARAGDDDGATGSGELRGDAGDLFGPRRARGDWRRSGRTVRRAACRSRR